MESEVGTVYITTPEAIELNRLVTLRISLGLEMKGMKRSRGPSAYSIAKRGYKLKGSRQSVYDQLNKLIQQKKGLI